MDFLHSFPRRFCVTIVLLASVSAPAQQPKFGEAAPSLALELIQAPPSSVAEWPFLRGKAVVMEFWATWCAGCVAEIKNLNALADQFNGQGVRFISVTDEDAATVRHFLAQRPISGWVALDHDGQTFRRYGIEGRPLTALVDANGILRGIVSPNEVDEGLLNKLLAGLLRIPQPATVPVPPIGTEANSRLPLVNVLIRPALPNSGMSPGAFRKTGNKQENWGLSGNQLLAWAFKVPETHVIAPEWCAKTRYDISILLPDLNDDAIQAVLRPAVTTTLGLNAKREVQESEVYVLSALPEATKRLLPRDNGYTLRRIVSFAEGVLQKPVIDETGMTGRYDYVLEYEPKKLFDIVGSFGLSLTKQRRNIELVIAKAQNE